MDRRALIDERIKILLTSTDLTFKEIIEKMRNENMSVSFNSIRRVNRNHRYRKPRYDAKLTPHQRRELINKLKNTTRPNLSSLARQYGVCHGSIWYWWDKLSKMRERNNGQILSNEPSNEFDELLEQDLITSSGGHPQSTVDYLDSDPLDLDDADDKDDSFETNNKSIAANNSTNMRIYAKDIKTTLEDHQQSDQKISNSSIVGQVQAKSTNGEFISLPIIMYSSNTQSNWNIEKTKLISKASSSNNYTATNSHSSTSQAGSLSKRLGIS